jgi:thiamine kinase-like enzyme
VLLDASLTVIHGEFYPENVLFHEGRVVPVDWETAALAAGEIDLASLVEGWPAVVASGCEQRYSRSRWPSGPPYDLERTLAAARAYWSLRWLGQGREWLDQEQRRRYLETLRNVAERLPIM